MLVARDWVAQILGLLQWLQHGFSKTLAIPFDNGWTGEEVVDILHAYGIETYAHGIYGDAACFKVMRRDYKRTCAILRYYGIFWRV